MLHYSLIGHAGNQTLTVLTDDGPLVADNTHPRFNAIVEAVFRGEHNVRDLFDSSATVAKRFEALTERISVAGGTIFFDGDPVHNSLTQQVVRFLEEDVDDWLPLVSFFEKVQQNPEPHSREQLFDWLQRFKFTITDDGDFLAYKGLRADGTSVMSGPAIVNGEAMNGHIPNAVGSVVEIGRSQVQHAPSVGCASGLHAGTWGYARGFGHGKIVRVRINPRDVVSVPTDCNWQKIRCCRYEVLEEVTKEDTAPVYYTDGFQQGFTDRGWKPDATL